MKDFVHFLLTKVYQFRPIPEILINTALVNTVEDIKYHFPNISEDEIGSRIKSNSNELAVFLFRLGSEIHIAQQDHLKPQVHWLLKELCGCEIYFNNEIAQGFYVVHGTGTIIGSRNRIGKGFKIHQGCTIGHKKNGVGNGNTIGNDVTLYANSSIIGELQIGDNVIIGGHVMVSENIAANSIVTQKGANLIRTLTH